MAHRNNLPFRALHIVYCFYTSEAETASEMSCLMKKIDDGPSPKKEDHISYYKI